MSMFDLSLLVPEGMTLLNTLLLIAMSFFTSLLTASLGIGGGTVLLAVMAQVIPAKAIVPVHGVVQLGSNTGRALIMIKNINTSFVTYFLLGCLVGALIGGQVVVSLPKDLLRLILGIFILTTVWAGSLFPNKPLGKKGIVIGGGITTLLTMFVGATGPLIVSMLKQLKFGSVELVATTAGSLVIQHSLKILIFGLLGFVFSPYIPMISAMIITGFMGTLLGKRILVRTPPARFKRVLDILITVLALRLIYVAIHNLYF